MNAFLAGELILGAVFITIVFYTVNNLFDTPEARWWSFLLLLTLPYMQIFFGYVELYAIVICALSFYILLVVVYFKQKIPFYFLPAVYLVLTLVHYLNALLAPSLLYVAYLEYKQNKFKHLVISVGLLAVTLGLCLFVSGFDIGKFIPPPRSTPLLSLTANNDTYQAYTLFSLFHFIDLANLIVLLFSPALFLFLLTFLFGKKYFFSTPVNKFFLISGISLVFFFAVAKFDLPLAQDWDVVSSYAYLITLFAIVVTLQWMKSNISVNFGAISTVILAGSLLYFYVNASVTPNIDRVKTFIDTRVSSHDGCYQSTLHLMEYFIYNQDQKNITEVSEHFIDLFPNDKRGYSNYTLYLMQFGKQMDEKITGIFERWMRVDSGNIQVKKQYADFLLDIGNRSYHEGSFAEARAHLEKSLMIHPTMSEAYNSLGMIYRQMGNNDSAIIMYKKMVALNPKSVFAYINLGNAYDDKGNADTAIAWYERALLLQPENGNTYYNMGFCYVKQKRTREATEAFKHAARLGVPEAQQFLRERGETW
jgi:TolA-binding protein